MPELRPSACALALLMVAACGEDSFTPVDGASVDAIADDATAVDAAAVDAAAIDAAAVDATAVDASATSVVVTVYEEGVLAAGIAVQYHAANGAHLATVTTAANGTVTIPSFPAGGSVTVPLSPGGSQRTVGSELTTILDVQPGDHLTFGASFGGVQQATLTITTPPSSPSGNGYSTKVGCGSYYANPGSTFTARPLMGCFPLGATTFDAVTYTGPNDFAANRTGYAVLTDQPLSGTAPSQTGSATFGAASTTFASHTVSAANITASSAELATWGFRNGVTFGQDRGTIVSGGTSSQTMKYADGFFDGVAAELHLRHSNNSFAHAVVRTAQVATASTPMTTTFDASTDAPGSFDTPTVAAGAPETVSWTSPTWQCRDATGAPDVIQIAVIGDYVPTFFGNNTTHTWTILAPGTITSPFTVPVLDPATIATLWPRASFTTLRALMTFTADSTLDWAGFRTSVRAFDSDFVYPPGPGTRCTLGR